MKNFLEKVQKKGPAGRKRQDRKGNRTMQKNKRGDSKVESNDSPEIPDRGGDIRHPQSPFGGRLRKRSPRIIVLIGLGRDDGISSMWSFLR